MDRRIGTPQLLLLVMLISVMSLAYVFKETNAQEAIEDSATAVRVADAAVSSNLVVNNAFIDPEHHCEGCTRMVYTPGSKDEAGIAYKDDKLDLGNSQRIVFFAKGQPSEHLFLYWQASLPLCAWVKLADRPMIMVRAFL